MQLLPLHIVVAIIIPSEDFIDFLKILDEKYDKGKTIRIVLDNHTAHTSKKTREYLGSYLYLHQNTALGSI